MRPDRNSLLLVDDDPAMRALLRDYLAPHGFDVADAAGGAEALALLRQHSFDVVLLDVEMPDMSGLDVLRALRSSHTATDLPVMMATVKDRASDVVEALRAGANDYVTKPFAFEVVLARLQTQCSLKRATDRARQLNDGLARANRRMREELEAAARVQEALLPTAVPRLPGATFSWHYWPCAVLAGDLLGLVALPGQRVCLYVLDVVDHGVKAALLAVMINRELTRLLSEGGAATSPVEVAAHLNREFPYNDSTEQFFTLMLGVLDVGTGAFRYVAAGHPGPLLIRRDGEPRCLRVPGSPIGLGAGEYEEHRLELAAGDRMYLFSDGLTDARAADERRFGEPRCVELLAAARGLPLGESVGRLVRAIEEWCAPGLPHDDISIAAVELA